jgi:hypothetical protein
MDRVVRRTFLSSGAALAGAALVGCGPPWQVVVEAPRNPLQGQRRFAVLPIDFAGLRVGDKTEVEWLAARDVMQRASFDEDKAAMNDRFARSLEAAAREHGIVVVLATGPADAPFLVRASVGFIEPGFFVGVAAAPSKTEMDVRIMAPDGRIFDEILTQHATRGTFGIEASIGGRLRRDAEGLGEIVAKYLYSRVRDD